MRNGNNSQTLLMVALLSLSAIFICPNCYAQNANAAKQKLAAERFLKVLLNRPAPGTALDRVYAFHLQAGTLNKLLADLQQQAADDPASAGQCHLLIGLLHQQTGDANKAIAAFTKAESVRKDDFAPSFYLGKALNSAGETDAAADALQRSIDRKPPRTLALQVFSELGRLYQRTKQSEKALKVWRQLEATFPGDSRVSEQIARTMYEEGELDEALRRYEALAKRSKTSQDSRAIGYQVTAAELKKQLGRTDEALADFETLLSRLRPSSWLHSDVRQRVESVFLQDNDYAALADYYIKQVEKRPSDVELKVRLGNALFAAGRLNEAKDTLLSAVKTSPTDTVVRLTLIDILKRSGDANQAAKQLQTLIAQESDNPDYLVQLGNTWLEDTSLSTEAKQNAAAAAWQKLADIRNDDPVATAQVADLMRRIDRTETAIKLYRHAIELAPDQPQYREYLGQHLFQKDRKKEALATWQEIAAGTRKNTGNLIRLAEVLNGFQYREKAIETFSIAAQDDLMFGQRMRFAQLLMNDQRYDDSLEQIDLAASTASTNDEREQLLRARIDIYIENGSLEVQIANAKGKANETDLAEDHRQHAMLLSAAGRNAEAVEAINAAITADPNSVSILVAAAELFRDGSRYVRAIETYQQLTKIDKRFSSSYLRQISTLQLKQGNVEAALAAAQKMIDAAPGNAEPIRFYAEQCFAGGRYDLGIKQLREALRTSPDDKDTRNQLANTLANHFRTDEAIALFWQTLADSESTNEKEGVVRSLAYLYDRSGDFSTLIRRLESSSSGKSDAREAILLKAAAHEAIYDLGTARESLKRLLDKNPRDVDILQRLVKLSLDAFDYRTALDYQQRLVGFADTPEHRRIELLLLVECGKIQEAKEAIEQTLLRDEDIATIKMIDRLRNQNQAELAIQLCESLLVKDGSLWEVQARLAALYFTNGQKDKAQKLAEKILDHRLEKETQSQLARSGRRFGGKSGRRQGRSSASKPMSAAQAMCQQTAAQLGFLPAKLATSRGPSVSSYQQARYIAIGIELQSHPGLDPIKLRSRIIDRGSTAANSLERLWLEFDVLLAESTKVLSTVSPTSRALTTSFRPIPQPQIGTVITPRVSFATPQFTPTASATASLDKIGWKIAALDEETRPAIVQELMSIRQGKQPTLGIVRRTSRTTKPLESDRLQIARDALRQLESLSKQTQLRNFAAIYHAELKLAKRETEATELEKRFLGSVDTPMNIVEALKFAAATRQTTQTTTLLMQLRDQLSAWADTMTAYECDRLGDAMSAAIGTTKSTSTGSTTTRKLLAIDLLLALTAIKQEKRHGEGGYLSQSQTTRVKVIGADRKSKYFTIPIPQNALLVSSALANKLYVVFGLNESSAVRTKLQTSLLIESTILKATKYQSREQQLRGTTVAFVSKWMGKTDYAIEKLNLLCQQYPDADDLAIELVRMHISAKNYDTAIGLLDSIDTEDHRILKQRELLALNAASKLEDNERALAAAKTLHAMNLSQTEQRSLMTSLLVLGENELADAVRLRSYRRNNQSIADQLAIANEFLTNGKKRAAAEVANAMLRRLSGSSNREAVQQRASAVQILTSTGRLESLAKQTERRAKSSPSSFKLQSELADLYDAMGRNTDALQVYQAALEKNRSLAPKIWAKAKQLYSSSQREQAGNLFLLAFQQQPELLGNDYSIFLSSISTARKKEDLMIAVGKIDLNRLQPQARASILALISSSTTQSSRTISSLPLSTMVRMMESTIRSGSDSRRKSLGLTLGTHVFATPEAYDPSFVGWKTGYQSATGEFQGFYHYCFASAVSNTQLSEKLKQNISARMLDAKTKSFAEVLSIGTVEQDRTNEELDVWVKELLKKNPNVPVELWWQIGGVLAMKGRNQPAITILNSVRSRMPSARDVIANKLLSIQIGIGDVDSARSELLMVFASTINAHAVPLSLSQLHARAAMRLQHANQFSSMGMRMESLMVCNEALRHADSVPSMGSTHRRLEALRDSLIQSVTPQNIRDFISRVSRESGGAPGKTTLDTDSLAPQMISAVEYALAELAKTESGRTRLKELGQTRRSQVDRTKSVLVSFAMETLVDLATDKPKSASKLDQLTSLLPSDTELTNVKRWADLPIVSPPAMAGLRSGDSTVQASADKLAQRITSIAKLTRQSSVGISLCKARLVANGNTADISKQRVLLSDMRAFMEPQGDGASEPTASTADCLELAETAVQYNLWEDTLQSLALAFPGGKIRLGDSSRLTTTTARKPLMRELNVHAALTKRMRALISQYPSAPSKSLDQSAYQSLCKIVFSPGQSTSVFPHLSAVVDDPATRSQKFSPTKPVSVARLLAETAARSGNEDDLEKRLQQLRAGGEVPSLIADMIFVQLAAELQSDEKLSTALINLNKQLKPYALGSQLSSAAKLNSVLNVGEPKQVVDVAIHAIVPLHDHEERSQELIEVQLELLRVAANDRISSNAAEVWTWLARDLIGHPDVSDEVAAQAVEACLSSTKLRYGTTSSTHAKDSINKQSMLLLRKSLTSDRRLTSGRLLHDFARYRSGFHISSDAFSQVSMDLLNLDPDYRLELLTQMLLGNDDEAPSPEMLELASPSGIVLHAEPPKVLQSETPFLGKAKQISIGHSEFPITSGGLFLADTAAACSKSQTLADRLRKRIESTPKHVDGDESEAILGLVLLADKQVEAAAKILTRVAKQLKATAPNKPQVSPLPIESALLLARCSEVDSLRDEVAECWPALIQHADQRRIGIASSFFQRFAANLKIGPLAGARPTPAMKHWINVQLPYLNTPATKQTSQLTRLHERALYVGAGSDQSVTMLKYPIAGDFTLQYRIQSQGTQNAPGVFYQGTSYLLKPDSQTMLVRACTGRNYVTLSNVIAETESSNSVALTMHQGQVDLIVNGVTLNRSDTRTRSMPFAGIFYNANATGRLSEITIKGKATIPRSVNLLEPQLRGWSCPVIDGAMVDAHLPAGKNEFVANLVASRNIQQQQSRLKTTWFVSDGKLQTGQTIQNDLSGQRHVQYARPLLPGESFTYEFYYDPLENLETHATIGRTAILFRKDRLMLRWMRQRRSAEAFMADSLNEVPMPPNASGTYQLEPMKFNTVTIKHEPENVFSIIVNGSPAGRIQSDLDQRFGFLCEKGYEADIRKATLAGPWPEQLPADLMTPSE